MSKIFVKTPQQPQKEYPIIIDKNLLQKSGELIKSSTKAKKLLIVTNPTVEKLYLKQLTDSLKNLFEYDCLILDDGEEYKNITSLEKIWTKAIDIKLERKDAIVALGGGVIGDITGFAAASYLRGVDFIQIPTTLLAQVDSSVGGKVAINHQNGKNLMGAFYQPKIVIADINTLNTLPEREIKTGLAEIIKYAFIEKTCNHNKNFDLMNFLQTNSENIKNLNHQTIQKLVAICCELKACVVNQDETEKGLRAILNFGHTIAHSIEKCTNYTAFTHGEAVAMGLKGAFEISLKKHLISQDYFDTATSLLDEYNLIYKLPQNIPSNDLYNAMFSDKKVENKHIRFILATSKAEVKIFDDIDKNTILEVLENLK